MNEPGLQDIWVYLSASPLLGLTITLVAYGLAYRLYLKTNSNPLANPVVTSVAMLIILLLATGTSYSDYFEGGQFVHFLLGPATVALAVPLYQQFSRLRQLWLPVTISLFCGVVIAAGSSISVSQSPRLTASLANFTESTNFFAIYKSPFTSKANTAPYPSTCSTASL